MDEGNEHIDGATADEQQPPADQRADGSQADQVPEDNDAEPTRYVLVLLQSGDRRDFYGSMNRNIYEKIRGLLADIVSTPRETSHVDLWLESPGGSATIAFKIWLELRARFSHVRVVIADYAKSAATLLSAGADEIVMAAGAEMGPLDVQIEHPDREHVTISGLDHSRALGFLAEFAVDYVIAGGGQVLESTLLPRRDVLREFSSFTAHLLEPLMSKLDPQLIHRYS